MDVNLIYDIRTRVRNYKLYNDIDIQNFLSIYYKKGKQGTKELEAMTSLLKSVLERYSDLNEEEQYEFRVSVRSFNKWYAYIIQVARLFDKELHQEYVFTSYLDKFIPKPSTIEVSIEDKLKLEYFKLKETFKGDITLNPKHGGWCPGKPEGNLNRCEDNGRRRTARRDYQASERPLPRRV